MQGTGPAVSRWRVPTAVGLPQLDGLPGVAAVVPVPASTSTCLVADTDELSLARWGGGLIHDGSAWTLRVPPHPGTTDVPVVHRFSVGTGTIPAAAVRAVGRLVAGEPLVRVARLVTRRDAVLLAAPGGEPLVQVAVEEVSVHAGRRLRERFREVVVRPSPAAVPELLDAVDDRLRAGGALGREEVPREVRVLGPVATSGPDLPSPPDGAVAGAWGEALSGALQQIVRCDPHLRLDTSGAAAAATAPVVGAARGLVTAVEGPDEVHRSLTTLLDLLGAVAHAAARMAAVADVEGPLRDLGGSGLAAAVRDLHRHLDSPAHAAAVDGLRRLVAEPLREASGMGSDVDRSVAGRVAVLLADLDVAPDTPASPWPLHGVAAAAAVADGKPPRRLARAARRAADAAGAHATSRDVLTWLGTVATDLSPAEAFAAGRLAGRRADGPADALDEWRDAVGRLMRPKATDWLSVAETADDEADAAATPPVGVPDPTTQSPAARPEVGPSSRNARPSEGNGS